MMLSIKVNLEEIESMLYFWQATKDREKVSEVYLHEIATLPGLTSTYTAEFNGESVRKVLSAITNREKLSAPTKAEGRFWNNHMWMMEDLGYTMAMAQPIKQLNLDDMAVELAGKAGDKKELEVRFSPLSMEDYKINGTSLVINFFKVKPDEETDGGATIDGLPIKEYVKAKLLEVLK